MKLDFDNLEVRRKINLLAEICHYGIEWNRDLPPESSGDYIIGGVETTAHILSCCIVQWFGFESCGTADTSEFLKMDVATRLQRPVKIGHWEMRITEYLKNSVDGQEN